MTDSQYLEAIVAPIVTNPSAIRIERLVDDRGVLLTLFVDPVDMGRVIGQKGETARAIRRFLKLYGMMNNSRVSMRLDDPRAKAVPFGATDGDIQL